jgi:L-ribulose-5-phosphate 3-epimerase
VAAPALRFAYNTNGLAHHRLPDALDLLAAEGYDGVGLTLDVAHLDPFRATPSAVRRTRRHLERLGLAVVVETGARFLLDPARKHRPTLLSREGAGVRRDFLERAIAVAADLGAPVVSLWSGAADPGTEAAENMRVLAAALDGLAGTAEAAGVTLGFEPEPGMFVDSLAAWDALRALCPHPRLGLTLDVGHVLCEPGGDPAAAIAARGPTIVNVQIEDVKRGVHEHLPFGAGDLDLPGTLAALRAAPYGGLVGVELSRDSHRAAEAVRESIRALRAASGGGGRDG